MALWLVLLRLLLPWLLLGLFFWGLASSLSKPVESSQRLGRAPDLSPEAELVVPVEDAPKPLHGSDLSAAMHARAPAAAGASPRHEGIVTEQGTEGSALAAADKELSDSLAQVFLRRGTVASSYGLAPGDDSVASTCGLAPCRRRAAGLESSEGTARAEDLPDSAAQ